MKTEYFYQKNEYVFAETNGHKPYPARVTKVKADLGVYTVSFIGYKSTSDILAGNMEKFDDLTINKYMKLYQGSTDREERTILKKIDMAKREYDRNLLKNYKKKIGKDSRKGSLLDQKIDPQPLKQRLEAEMGETKVTPDQFEQQVKTEWKEHKIAQNQDNSSSYFNIMSNHQKPIKKYPHAMRKQEIQQQTVKKEIEETLNKLSPVHSNADPPFQDIRSQSSSSLELLSAQTISSAASLHFGLQPKEPKKEIKPKEPIQIIKEENEISRNTTKCANHPIYDRHYQQLPSVSSSQEGEVEGKVVNICEEVSIYEIDCHLDELQLQETDYWGLLEYMTYRKKKLSILSEGETISHLIKIIDILLHELERARGLQQASMLIMKKKQYLIAILSQAIPLKYFLNDNCLDKMIGFVTQYQVSSPSVKSTFVTENFNIRSRLNILYQKFIRTDSAQLSLSQQRYDELQKRFEQYKEMKFVY